MRVTLFLFILIGTTKLIAQSCTNTEELLRKRHTIKGMTYGHPYTTFDRHNINYKNLQNAINNIRRQILKEKDDTVRPIFLAYQEIYNNAVSPMPLDNGLAHKFSDGNVEKSYMAAWAKDNAFVFLIGLDSIGRKLDSIDPSGNKRDAFRDRAKDEAFGNFSGDINSEKVGWGWVVVLPLINSVYNFNEELKTLHNIQFCSRSLILWLQTYDLLKAAYEIRKELDSVAYNRYPWGFGDKDRNGLECSQRNKLRKLTRDLYYYSKGIDGIVEHATGWKKNHGIAAASALLMSAQVLNDAGTETNYFTGLLGWLWGDGYVTPFPKYSPINWNELGQKGLEENLFVGNHRWPIDDVPVALSKTWESYSPYSEGTHYTHYGLLDCGIPAMVAQKNLYPDKTNEPYLNRNEIINIFKWFDRLQTEDGTVPNIDNSTPFKTGILAITGIPEFNRGINGLQHHFMVDYVAMIGGNNIPLYTNKKAAFDEMMDAGNIVLRNETYDASHTFYMLAEHGMALDKQAWKEPTHEDDDMGSFSFYAKNTKRETDTKVTVPLSIDPGYFGWGNQDATNKYWMHNTVEIDDGNPAKDRYYQYPKYSLIDEGKFSKQQQFNLSFDFKNEDHTLFGSAITRNVNAINKDNNFYYFVNDYVNVDGIGEEDGTFQYINLNLNGNGNKDHLNSYRKENNIHKWTYPCSVGSKWSLAAHVSALHSGISGQSAWEGTENTDAKDVSNNVITKLTVHQPVSKTIFQSFLLPYRCDDTLPTVTKIDDKDFVSTTIRFINRVDTFNANFVGKNSIPNPATSINDSVSHIHFTRWDGNIADSVTNPFNLPSQTTYKLKLDAQKAFIINHTYGESRYGYKYCPISSTNIKHASFSNGTYLKFKDSIIISSTKAIDASISFSGRQLYLCSIKALVTPNSADSVKFHLADVGRGVEMLALRTGSQDTIPSRYDSLTNTINIALPTEETTFYVQEKFNCINCYFPPNWKGIDTTFEIEDGVKHTLGHKLAIKQPTGLLKLTNSSKLDFCSGVYVNSLDSIIIEGPCQTKAFSRKSCKGIDSMVAAYSDNSSITITSGSALVLGAGSYTHVKNGGAIYVKRNGSLIVKAGAFLQIGDSGTCNSGWGEIVAEPGAYIHIEPDAHIEYRRTAGDTVDRNLFLIPTQAGLDKANEGVYFVIKSILQTDNILPDTSLPFFTYPICGLDTTCPIVNKEWGYTSFGKPMAVFQAKNDTLCPGEPLHIKLNRIVNDARYQIKVCRMDSLLIRNAQTGINTWIDTCIMDTIVQDSILPDPVCKEPHNTPEDWTYYFNPGTLHRVTISVWNDCELFDDTTAYIYTTTQPDVEIDIPSTACEGIGTFTANLVDYHPTPVTYAIEVTEKPDTNSIKLSKGILAKTYTQSYYGLLPSTIGFGDYFFKGGRTYLVSLTISNSCGTISVYDSITIPSGVSITLERPTAYAQIVSGATSVKLKGFITDADSFHWEPTYWLDSITSLTPISTPLDSVTYILVAKKGTCIATDTAHIKYNRYANAGYADTLCFDSTHSTETLIGFPYDMSLFLGMLYYYDNTQFMSYYNSHNTGNISNYFRYFTHFMHTDNFKNSATSCTVDLFNLFTNTLQKELFFSKSWYRGYYMQFTQFNNPGLNALNIFADQVINNTTLKNHLDSLNNWSNIDPCINDILNLYDDYVQNHRNEITTTWSKIVNNDTTNLTNWNNFFVAENAPTKSSKYILSVIAPSVAEIDEITILVDTILTPLFAPAMQFDSTVYLMNYTEPNSKATHYEWNFGDGSANSFETHPIHTFPAFDSNYVVCLIASNFCSSFTYCDTVWIDSLHLGGTLYTKKQTAFYEINNASNKTVLQNETNYKPGARSQQLVALINYPNPFNNSTIIDYEIWQNYTNAELRITNVLGQTLFTQKLNKPIDKIHVDGGALSNGIYYYSIIIDGTVSQTKNMSVIH